MILRFFGGVENDNILSSKSYTVWSCTCVYSVCARVYAQIFAATHLPLAKPHMVTRSMAPFDARLVFDVLFRGIFVCKVCFLHVCLLSIHRRFYIKMKMSQKHFSTFKITWAPLSFQQNPSLLRGWPPQIMLPKQILSLVAVNHGSQA